MPKYKINFEVESNDYCGIVEYGHIISEEIDAIVDNPELSAFEKNKLLDDILTYSAEFKSLEDAVRESAEDEFSKDHEEDEEDYYDFIADLNSTSRFRVVTNDEEEREIKL